MWYNIQVYPINIKFSGDTVSGFGITDSELKKGEVYTILYRLPYSVGIVYLCFFFSLVWHYPDSCEFLSCGKCHLYLFLTISSICPIYAPHMKPAAGYKVLFGVGYQK